MTSIRQFLGNIGLPDLNRAQGVDVYGKYQGYFRPETATQRIDFAIQKLTEGVTIVDAKRDEIWAGVKQIGMRGAYHYQRSGVSWYAQANYFLDFAAKYDHHFIALDVEKINNTLDNTFISDMYRIFNHWKDQVRGSKKIVLYSNYDVFNNFILPKIRQLFGDAGVKWLVEEVDVWYAQYYFLPSVNKQPSLPPWMKTWKLWQITASAFKGSEFGVQSQEVDVDVFNGTADQMRAWLGLAPGVPEEPEEPPVVVEPPARPVLTPEPRLWDAEVMAFRRMTVRNYPEVAADTVVKGPDGISNLLVVGGERFSGKIWAGNDYLWIRIETSPRPVLIGKWVAVRKSDGLEKFITLFVPKPADEDTWTDYYEILHDQFCKVMYFTPRMLQVYLGKNNYAHQKTTIGYPAVVPLQSPEGRKGSPLTADILWFLFDLCVKQQYGFSYNSSGWKALSREQKRKIASEFETFYDSSRFITNNAGIDINFNPIGEAILGQPHRSGIAKQLEVVTTGNLLKAVSHTPVMMLADDFNQAGELEKMQTPCIQIQTWDGKGTPEGHLIHWATNTTPFNFQNQWSRTGPWLVNHMHFFDGKGSRFVVYSQYPQFIALNRVRRLLRSELAAWQGPSWPQRK